MLILMRTVDSMGKGCQNMCMRKFEIVIKMIGQVENRNMVELLGSVLDLLEVGDINLVISFSLILHSHSYLI